MKREHLTLMRRCLEDVADEAERSEFISLLGEDPELLTMYGEEIDTIADLEWYHAIERNHRDAVRRKGELAEEMIRRQQVQARWVGIAAAAAILLIAFTYGSYRLLETRPSATMEVSEGAKWSVRNQDSEKVEGMDLGKGYKVNLSRGIMDIEFQDGVIGTLEAPARLEFVDRKLVRLSEGRLFINVRKERGKGFTVETPGLKAVDLGTRFGLSTSANGADEVHVQKGHVWVASKAALHGQRLGKNQAARLMPDGKLALIPAKPASFIDSISNEFPPFIHWSFDFLTPEGFPSNGTLPGASAFPARVVHLRGTTSPPVSSGRTGGALILHGLGDFAETEFPPIPEDQPFTITGWLKANGPTSSPPKEEPLNTPRRNLISWGTYDANQDSDGVAIDFPFSAQRKSVFSTVLGTPGSRTVSAADCLDGEWHHFASVSTGKRRRDGSPEILLFLDGVPLNSDVIYAPRPGAGALIEKEPQPLRFGIAAVPLVPNLHTFAASIDEVRIFQAALSEPQVRSLFTENQGPLSPR